jgi:hypothetical protein
MQRRSLAWIFLPAIIVVLAVAGLVISSFQEEAGIVGPGKGGLAAVAAVAEASEAVAGDGQAGYDEFSESLRVALVKTTNMPITNPADTRLQAALTSALDCLSAGREAWQAELDRAWDPAFHGSAGYWRVSHPALDEKEGAGLSPNQVREWSSASADHWLEKALDLAA